MKFITSKKRLFLIIVLALLIVGVASYLFYYIPADNTAIVALSSNGSYNVNNTSDYITFTPTSNKSSTGIIFYPGAKIQPEAYSVIASKLASNGYTTIIVKMPFNLAIFGENKANEVIAQHGEISTWVIAGHSLGGVYASDYAVNNQDKIKGLIYLGSYPDANASNATFKALSIRGSFDGFTTNKTISENLNKFPTNTTFITINGGNHYNFADIVGGVQEGDHMSTIDKQEQQNMTIGYILEFLKNL